jgi:hypothetical protein
MMFKNCLRKLGFRTSGGEKTAVNEVQQTVKEGREQDIKSLKDLNKSIKFYLEKGEVEVVIKNVSGVIKKMGDK